MDRSGLYTRKSILHSALGILFTLYIFGKKMVKKCPYYEGGHYFNILLVKIINGENLENTNLFHRNVIEFRKFKFFLEIRKP